MNEYIKQISERIRELRDILEFDAEDVAREIGVSKDEYLAYETGAKEIPISLLYKVFPATFGIKKFIIVFEKNVSSIRNATKAIMTLVTHFLFLVFSLITKSSTLFPTVIFLRQADPLL